MIVGKKYRRKFPHPGDPLTCVYASPEGPSRILKAAVLKYGGGAEIAVPQGEWKDWTEVPEVVTKTYSVLMSDQGIFELFNNHMSHSHYFVGEVRLSYPESGKLKVEVI